MEREAFVSLHPLKDAIVNRKKNIKKEKVVAQNEVDQC